MVWGTDIFGPVNSSMLLSRTTRAKTPALPRGEQTERAGDTESGAREPAIYRERTDAMSALGGVWMPRVGRLDERRL